MATIAAIYGPPLAVALMAGLGLPAVLQGVKDALARPRHWLEDRNRLREAARREGRYQELPESPEAKQWKEQGNRP